MKLKMAKKDESEIDASLQDFIFDSNRLETFYSKWSSVIINELTPTLLNAEIQQLDKVWDSLVFSFRAVYQSTEFAESSGSVEQKYSKCSESYELYKSQILEALQLIQPNPQSQLSPAQTTNPPNSNSQGMFLKVPACDTEIFHGGYEDWPVFRDMFTAVYKNHPKLSPAQKLYHLRQKTRSQAGQIVKQFPLTDESFELAWDALKSQYENRRILVDTQLKILLNLPPIYSENVGKIQNLQSTINNCLATLSTHGIPTSNWDPILVYLCSSKLPSESLSLWEQSLSSRKELPLWADMNKFLTSRYEVVERLHTYRPSNPKPVHSNFTPRTPSHNSTFANKNRTQNFLAESTPPISCKLCNTRHAMKTCIKVKALSVAERVKYVPENGYCENCLSNSHSSNNCYSSFLCVYCQKYTIFYCTSRVTRKIKLITRYPSERRANSPPNIMLLMKHLVARKIQLTYPRN
ncbi:uncharacterized protein [Eurosta solidaginis]|uniref:uncharacterized protein n=1 Tax=Eurosta solidaginis TaxID=178769 RepID=UPI0035312607